MNAYMGQPTLILAARDVTPSDTTVIPVTKALFVGAVGDVTVVLEEDSAAVTFTAVTGFLPLKVKQVLSTGTDATSILALY